MCNPVSSSDVDFVTGDLIDSVFSEDVGYNPPNDTGVYNSSKVNKNIAHITPINFMEGSCNVNNSTFNIDNRRAVGVSTPISAHIKKSVFKVKYILETVKKRHQNSILRKSIDETLAFTEVVYMKDKSVII